MPQSTKDSKGGKSHAVKNSSGGSSAKPGKDKKPEGRNPESLTGSQKHGEKKTTP